MKAKLTTLAFVLGAAGLMASTAHAQDKVKIGFITDMSSLYADVEGKNGGVAIQMAIDDFGGKVLGKPIELLTADHQNKADIAASKAREWIDTQGLTMIFSGTNSGTALALAKVAEEKKRVMINNGAASSALTNDQCTPYTVHYAYDTVALAKGTGGAIVDGGGKSWFFLTADYAFGHALEADTSRVVKEKGGTVVGAVRHPLNASDFSSFLLQAQNSKAQILGLANAGGDTINSIKAAKEFGIGGVSGFLCVRLLNPS
ncbi:ABC transporter substrate-binding protein, partial [Diaphorobacter sp. J5-51]|uniref:ABC transporter substrate-binding protein n=1 Tax=Diaphorobacter sp. J5-51 TaxID=680496 RepID=UPI0006435A6A